MIDRARQTQVSSAEGPEPAPQLRAIPPGGSQTARVELKQIARCAADAMNQELAEAAEYLIDLLGITDSLAGDADPDGRAVEIIDFCQQALPVIRDAVDRQPESEAKARALHQTAIENWGEYVELLPRDVRCGMTTGECDSGWDDGAWSQWNDADDCVGEREPDDASADDEFSGVNVSEIVSTLEGLTDSADGEPDRTPGEGHTSTVGAAALEVTEIDQIDGPEILAAYIDDAQQCLAGMEACLLQLESGAQADESLRQFCRELHTLKGASGTVGLVSLATWLHELENQVESMTSDGAEPDVDLLLSGVDAVRSHIRTFSSDGKCAVVTHVAQPTADDARNSQDQATAPQNRFAVTAPDTSIAASGGDTLIRLEASRLDRLMDLLAELVMLRNRRDTYVSALRDLRQELTGCALRMRTLEAARESSHRLPFSGGQISDVVTVREAGHSEIDVAGARRLSRSLVELSNDVTELGRSLHEICDPLSEDNLAVSHLIGQFRQELMELRRLPVTGLFQRLHRAARDAARTEKRQIELELAGQGTRAERSVQERLFEPLMHLVRNAVSHGIETASERTAAGKPRTGNIALEAWSDGSSLYVEVRDDGRGLDDEALERRGREFGLLPPGRTVSREDLWKLIFHPGFTTRNEAGTISGRGVGMDAVDSQIRRLRGRVDVNSEFGQGTTFRIQIPLRSAIEHAMVVRTGGQLFALPMQSVCGTGSAHHPARDVIEAGTIGTGRSAVPAASRAIPLRELLGLEEGPAPHQCVLSLRNTAPERPEADSPDAARGSGQTDQSFAIAVDAVVGVEEVVVRNLPPLLLGHELFAGVTLSGQAETVLLLDVPRLIESARRTAATTGCDAEHDTPGTDQTGNHTEQNRILIVDDSVTVRRMLARKLRAEGFLTVESSDGLRALQVLRAGGITAVVTDLDMPRMGGMELLSEIKRGHRFRSLPVVIVTGRDDQPILDRLTQLDADRILPKPITDAVVSEILQTIRETSRS